MHGRWHFQKLINGYEDESGFPVWKQMCHEDEVRVIYSNKPTKNILLQLSFCKL